VEVVVARINFFSPLAAGGWEVAAGLEQALISSMASRNTPIMFAILVVFICASLLLGR